MSWPYLGGDRPPRAWRPAPGEHIGPGRALWLLLDSIPTAANPEGPANAPLTAEEIEAASQAIADLGERR